MADRFSQMSEQAALIARKKAEIEARRLAGLEQGSVKSFSQLGSKSGAGNNFNKNNSAAAQNVANKNKWGFKGKSPQTKTEASKPAQQQKSPQQQQQQTAPGLKNTFNNDGSFLEQFRRMNEAKNQAAAATAVSTSSVPKAAPVKMEPIPTVPDPVVDKPPEADAWYKSALEKARQIAQSMKEGGPPPAQPESQEVVVNPIKSEPDVKPVKIEHESAPSEKDEYGNGSKVNPGPSSSSATIPTPSVSAIKSTKEYTDMVQKEEQPFHYDFEDDDREPLPIVVQELASMVALSGDQLEDIARARNVGEEQLAFLNDVNCETYKRYRCSVESMRRGMDAERIRNKEEMASKTSERKKSRWSDEPIDPVPQMPPGVATPFSLQQQGTAPPGANPQLIQYALRVYGTTDLDEDKWRQCEDQIKMSVVYNEMLQKKQAMEKLAQQGKRKYEYDSDEDVEGGTWEHKARKAEMEKTANEAMKLTEMAQGRHHIGDFLPPEELTKFMAKFQALKRGEEFDESDYVENKLTNENLGFKMLQRMGWNEGTGLGSDAQGITNPIGKGSVSADKKGLGTSVPHDLDKEDDEFDAYRKRMMLAYRFRPNPLNNPRRAYY